MRIEKVDRERGKGDSLIKEVRKGRRGGGGEVEFHTDMEITHSPWTFLAQHCEGPNHHLRFNQTNVNCTSDAKHHLPLCDDLRARCQSVAPSPRGAGICKQAAVALLSCRAHQTAFHHETFLHVENPTWCTFSSSAPRQNECMLQLLPSWFSPAGVILRSWDCKYTQLDPRAINQRTAPTPTPSDNTSWTRLACCKKQQHIFILKSDSNKNDITQEHYNLV